MPNPVPKHAWQCSQLCVTCYVLRVTLRVWCIVHMHATAAHATARTCLYPRAWCTQCYYWDYSNGVMLLAAVGFTSLGGMEFAAMVNSTQVNNTPTDTTLAYPYVHTYTWPPPNAMDSLDQVDNLKILSAAGAGAIFNVANLVLVVAIQIAGLSIAFPIGIGTALVLGTILIYLIDQTGDPYMLFPGVGLAFIAVVCMAAAHSKLEAARLGKATKVNTATADGGGMYTDNDVYDNEKTPLYDYDDDVRRRSEGAQRTGTGTQFSSKGKIGICIISGILMSLWGPLSSYSLKEPNGLTPYGSFLLYAGSVWISTPLLLVLQQYQFLIPRADQGVCRGTTRMPSPCAWRLAVALSCEHNPSRRHPLCFPISRYVWWYAVCRSRLSRCCDIGGRVVTGVMTAVPSTCLPLHSTIPGWDLPFFSRSASYVICVCVLLLLLLLLPCVSFVCVCVYACTVGLHMHRRHLLS